MDSEHDPCPVMCDPGLPPAPDPPMLRCCPLFCDTDVQYGVALALGVAYCLSGRTSDGLVLARMMMIMTIIIMMMMTIMAMAMAMAMAMTWPSVIATMCEGLAVAMAVGNGRS